MFTWENSGFWGSVFRFVRFAGLVNGREIIRTQNHTLMGPRSHLLVTIDETRLRNMCVDNFGNEACASCVPEDDYQLSIFNRSPMIDYVSVITEIIVITR